MNVGIDVGAKSVWVSLDGKKSEELPLVGAWYEHLWSLIPPQSIVALEFTGVYSHPLISALQAIDDVQVWTVAHSATGRWRSMFTSNKTDANDARALQHISTALARGEVVRGVRLYHELDMLRELVNFRVGLVRDVGRLGNRCKSIAAGVDPVFARDDKYLDYWAAFDFPDGVGVRRLLTDSAHLRQVLLVGQSVAAFKRQFQYVSPLAAVDEVKRRSLRWWYPRWKEAEKMLAIVDADLHVEARRVNPALFDAWMSITASSIAYVPALIVACRGSVLDFSPEEFRAVVGWRPERVESGEAKRGRLPKTGYAPARQALFLWTFGILAYPDHPVTQYFDSLQGTRSNRRTPAAGKLARVLHGIGRRAEQGKDWSEYGG